MSEPLNPAHVAWFKQLFRSLRDGGVWGIPRSGLLFKREGNEIVLMLRMPHDPGMPCTAAELAQQQEWEYEEAAAHFAASGITVRKAI